MNLKQNSNDRTTCFFICMSEMKDTDHGEIFFFTLNTRAYLKSIVLTQEMFATDNKTPTKIIKEK